MSSCAPWIVIAEDNAPDVFLIREALQWDGMPYRVDAMEDGEQVLQFIDRLEADLEAACPDLFVIDLNLPKRSGVEILSRIRASSRCAVVPAVVISSSDAPRDREVAKALGAELYFRKPAELKEFMTIGGHIHAVLKQGRSDAASPAGRSNFRSPH